MIQLMCRYLLCGAPINHLVEVCCVLLIKLLIAQELPLQAKYPLLHHRKAAGRRNVFLLKGQFQATVTMFKCGRIFYNFQKLDVFS